MVNNSGIWVEYKTSTVEDVQKVVLPLTRVTEHLYYNQRIIIDNKVLTEPRTWVLSKVNRLSSNGTVVLTFAQDQFDQHKDYIELDSNGNVIGMWADYYAINAEPVEDKPPFRQIHSAITYSGVKPEIKIGGRYKKFSVTFYDGEEPIKHREGNWAFYIGNTQVPELVSVKEQLDPATIEVKFLGDEKFLGKTLTIEYISNDKISSSIDVDIVSL